MFLQVLPRTLSHIHTHYVRANAKSTMHYSEWKKENDEYLLGFNFLNLASSCLYFKERGDISLGLGTQVLENSVFIMY